MPKDPRRPVCYYPFGGVGGKLARWVLGVQRSKMNPRLCNVCERFASHYHGGTELEVSLLFADVRGSTQLSEQMRPAAFSAPINRFYGAATKVLYRSNALVEKLAGDAANGFYVPGFTGSSHAEAAVRAGREILAATGHGEPGGPRVPVGVGVHFGTACVGSVEAEGGFADIAVLGESVNAPARPAAARLAAAAGPGEVILSEAARSAAGLQAEGMEPRRLALKDLKEAMDAWVIASP